MLNEIKRKYELIQDKMDFKERLADKLGVSIPTIKGYFCPVDTLPTKHYKYVLNRLNRQIEIDRKVNEIIVKDWEVC